MYVCWDVKIKFKILNMDKKVLLMILDGWGEGRQDESNVIYSQGAPYIESLRK